MDLTLADGDVLQANGFIAAGDGFVVDGIVSEEQDVPKAAASKAELKGTEENISLLLAGGIQSR